VPTCPWSDFYIVCWIEHIKFRYVKQQVFLTIFKITYAGHAILIFFHVLLVILVFFIGFFVNKL